jgi:hypothetical protein
MAREVKAEAVLEAADNALMPVRMMTPPNNAVTADWVLPAIRAAVALEADLTALQDRETARDTDALPAAMAVPSDFVPARVSEAASWAHAAANSRIAWRTVVPEKLFSCPEIVLPVVRAWEVENSAKTADTDFEETRAIAAAITIAAVLAAAVERGASAVNAEVAPVRVWVVTVPAGSVAVFACDCCG